MHSCNRLILRLVTTASVVALTLPAVATAASSGGSRSSGNSGYRPSGEGNDIGLLIMGVLLLGAVVFVVVAVVVIKRRLNRRTQEVREEAARANLADGYWDPAQLEARVREAFFPIHQAWEQRYLEYARPYLSDALYARYRGELAELEGRGQVRRVRDVDLKSVKLVNLSNVTDDAQDRFSARVHFMASDSTADMATGQVVEGSTGKNRLFQYWTFVRHPHYGWVVDEVEQAVNDVTRSAYESGPIVNEDVGPVGAQPPPAPR